MNDFEKHTKELEEQGIILKIPREFMKDFFNIDIKDGKQEENMDVFVEKILIKKLHEGEIIISRI